MNRRKMLTVLAVAPAMAALGTVPAFAGPRWIGEASRMLLKNAWRRDYTSALGVCLMKAEAPPVEFNNAPWVFRHKLVSTKDGLAVETYWLVE